MNLFYGVPIIFWQTVDRVLYVKLMLTHNSGVRVTKQLIVMKETAGNSILYGKHTYCRWVFLYLLEDLLESLAAYQLYLLAFVELMSRNVMERPDNTLYCYSFHISIFCLKSKVFHL